MKSNIFKIDIIPSRVLSKRVGTRFVYFDKEQNKWRYQRIKTSIGVYNYLATFLLSHLMEAYCVKNAYTGKNGLIGDGTIGAICNYCRAYEGFVDYEECISFEVTKKCALAKIEGVGDKGAFA